jgi:DNA-binding response OmpR family regulator
MLSDLLSRDGRFDVRTAANGYDAGMETVRFRPDIVLLDYMLPDINGIQVCRRIRDNPELSEVRVIIISGVARQSDIDELTSAGANAFLKKPFDINALIEKMLDMVAAP